MPMCLYLGDSIALGLHAYDTQCEVAATTGASAAKIAQDFHGRSGDVYTVVSMGSNQPDAADNLAKMVHIRAAIRSTVVWILPYNRSIATRVLYYARMSHDLTIDLASFPTKDGIHPTAQAARRIASIIKSVSINFPKRPVVG